MITSTNAASAKIAPKIGHGISWLSRALLLLRERADLSDAEIATAIEVDLDVLRMNPLYRRMAEFYRNEC